MAGRIWTVKDRECLDTVAKYMLKHNAAFDIPKVTNVEKEINVSTNYKIPPKINPRELTSIDVPGDGSCLFHSFLLATVGNLRTLPYSARTRIGQMFRTLLYHEYSGSPEFRIGGHPAFSENVETDVRDDALMFLMRKFRVNALVIVGKMSNSKTPTGEVNVYVYDESWPYIILYNKSQVHFTPVKDGDRYLFNRIMDTVPIMLNQNIPHTVFRSENDPGDAFMVHEDAVGDFPGFFGGRPTRKRRRTIRRKTQNKR